MQQSRDAEHEAGGISLSAHHNASQLRADGWNRLKHNAQRLAEAAGRQGKIAPLRAAVEEDLRLLEPVESYWAFPGKENIGRLGQLFRQGNFAGLAQAIARLNRALVSESYRSRQGQGDGSLLDQDDEVEDEPDEAASAEGPAPARPYFEVLIVDAISPREERELRAGLHRMRRADDSFIYEIVVVPSFEDALIAILFNYNIQACVIRYGFAFKSKNRLDLLQGYLAGIAGPELEEMPDSDRGPSLGALIGELRPEIDLYLVTDVSVEIIAVVMLANDPLKSPVFGNRGDFRRLFDGGRPPI